MDELEDLHADQTNISFYNYSQLSLSQSPRDSLKYFEISVPRHIRFAELKKINEQPHFTYEYVF